MSCVAAPALSAELGMDASRQHMPHLAPFVSLNTRGYKNGIVLWTNTTCPNVFGTLRFLWFKSSLNSWVIPGLAEYDRLQKLMPPIGMHFPVQKHHFCSISKCQGFTGVHQIKQKQAVVWRRGIQRSLLSATLGCDL